MKYLNACTDKNSGRLSNPSLPILLRIALATKIKKVELIDHSRPNAMKERLIPWLLLSLLIVICLVSYWPGLFGGFLFDDFPNIVENDRLTAIDDLSVEAIQSAMYQPNPGPVGRPVSFFTFALNIAFTGLDPFYFKITNLLIHIANGILVFLLIKKLFETINEPNIDVYITAISLAVAGAWLLHPLNLTSVLYVVQRMTALSALFVFSSLLLYSAGRVRQIKGNTGAAYFFAWIPATFILALFSKEIGILLIVYLYVLELTIFRFKAASRSSQLWLKNFYTVLAIIAIPAGMYFMYRHSLNYGNRDFTLVQRLLTESRVLFFYVQSIVVPNISSMAIFHDDYVISKSLFSPTSTIYSILALIAIATTAFWFRSKAPFFAFGVLFFFSSHLLESTVLPLELIHEHRNYIGSWGILLPLFYYLIRTGIKHRRETLTYIISITLVIGLATATRIRSTYWGDEILLAQYHAYHHPNSPRTMLNAGATFLTLAQITEDAELLDEALDYYTRAYRLRPKESSALISITSILHKKDDFETLQVYSATLLENLSKHRVSDESMNAFTRVSHCLNRKNCDFPFIIYKLMAEAMLNNPKIQLNSQYHAKVLSANSNMQLLEGNIENAIVLGEEALALDPNEIQYYLNQSMLMNIIGQADRAKDYLDRAAQVDNSQYSSERIQAIYRSLQDKIEREATPNTENQK